MRIRLCRRPQLLLFLPQGTHFPCPDRVLRHKYSWQLKKFLRHANPTSEVSDAIHHSIKLTAKSRISHRSVAQFVDIALSQVLKLPKVKSFNALPAVAAIDYPFNKMPRLEKNFFPPTFPRPVFSGISFEVDLCSGLKANCCELLTGNLFDCTYLLVLHIYPLALPLPLSRPGLSDCQTKSKRRRACRANPLHLSCVFCRVSWYAGRGISRISQLS